MKHITLYQENNFCWKIVFIVSDAFNICYKIDKYIQDKDAVNWVGEL